MFSIYIKVKIAPGLPQQQRKRNLEKGEEANLKEEEGRIAPERAVTNTCQREETDKINDTK